MLTLACALMTFVGGVIAGTLGQITCHQEDESSRINPRVCHSFASDTGWALEALIPPLLVIALGAMRLSRRALIIATLALLLAEVGLGVLFGTLG